MKTTKILAKFPVECHSRVKHRTNLASCQVTTANKIVQKKRNGGFPN